MPRMDQLFPSKWLSAAELVDEDGDAADMILTIKTCKLESLEVPGQPAVEKPVLYFEEIEKGFVLNKTNGKSIAALYGNDTDDWEGKPVTLYATEVNFQGTMTPTIRVRSMAPKKAKPATLRTPPATLTPKNPGPLVRTGSAAQNDDIVDQDIPF